MNQSWKIVSMLDAGLLSSNSKNYSISSHQLFFRPIFFGNNLMEPDSRSKLTTPKTICFLSSDIRPKTFRWLLLLLPEIPLKHLSGFCALLSSTYRSIITLLAIFFVESRQLYQNSALVVQLVVIISIPSFESPRGSKYSLLPRVR